MSFTTRPTEPTPAPTTPTAEQYKEQAISKIHKYLTYHSEPSRCIRLTDTPADRPLPPGRMKFTTTINPTRSREATYNIVEGHDPRSHKALLLPYSADQPALQEQFLTAIYSQNIISEGCGKGLLAWLHDNLPDVHRLRRVFYTYHCAPHTRHYANVTGAITAQATDGLTFQSFVSFVVHGLDRLEYLHLTITREFWDFVEGLEPEHRNAEGVFNFAGGLVGDGSAAVGMGTKHLNMLQQLARVHPRTAIALVIEGSELSSQRTELVRGLVELIERKRRNRPTYSIRWACGCSELEKESGMVELSCVW